jgi:hypothetical protein
VDELAISRLETDRLAGLPAGYSGKLLGKGSGVPKQKRMWRASLEAILGTLGLQIIIKEYAATSRTLSRREPVDQVNQRFDNKCNSAKPVPKFAALLQDKTPPASRAHLRVIQGKRRGSKYG